MEKALEILNNIYFDDRGIMCIEKSTALDVFNAIAELEELQQKYFVSKSKWYYITPAGVIDNFIIHSGLSPKSAYVLSKVHTLYKTWEEANTALADYKKIFTTFTRQ